VRARVFYCALPILRNLKPSHSVVVNLHFIYLVPIYRAMVLQSFSLAVLARSLSTRAFDPPSNTVASVLIFCAYIFQAASAFWIRYNSIASISGRNI
jgi:hypothetical protein